MLELYDSNEKLDNITPPVSETELNDEQVIEEIWKIKKELGDNLVILGHHYQQDDIIQFADHRGDSLALAQKASSLTAPYVIFCGVHFMAETADMLTTDEQTVVLPDLNAGCSMADMANDEQINKCWKFLTDSTSEKIVPVTYINCTASLKAFVGSNGGSICTSSNAHKIINWALEKGEKLLFFPDQHLGRNTCFDMGIPLEDMIVYNPNMLNGGVTAEQIQRAKVILWYGYCSVHQGFKKEQVELIKKKKPETTIIVHPECSFDVVQASHKNGSTAYIINEVENAPAGSSFAVGTEINLVKRLASENKDKEVFSLSPFQCLCTTMYRVRPRWLLGSLRAIQAKKPVNTIKVDSQTTKDSLTALNKMLEIS